jgi:hypothetical protein
MKKLIKKLRFEATADTHERILGNVLEALEISEQQKSAAPQPNIWRIIMKSPVTRVAVVLLLIVGIAVVKWQISDKPKHTSPLTFLSLINTASAAEQALFTGDRIVHITHEITLYPNTDAPDMANQLNDLIDSNFSRNKDAAFMRAWFSSYVWLPVHSLGPDGEIRWHKLELAETAEEACLIQEHIWYDPDSGFFARVFKQQDQVLFALSYDGQAVYLTQASDDGRFQIQREPITERFSFPDNPAEFLGISASFRDSMDMMNLPPVEEQSREQLADGTPVRVYKLRWQDTDAYHVFKVHDNDDTIEQIESVAYGWTIQQIQRVSSDSVDVPGISWNLAELAGQSTPSQPEVIITDSMTTVTAQQMADRALVETFVFGRTPDWIAEQTFMELLDEASPMRRMFMVLCSATNGRHVILIQGSTLGQYLQAAFKMNEQAGFRWTPRVFAGNRFKMHVLPEMRHLPDDIGNRTMRSWSSGQIFKESGFEPSENARAYVLHSPTNTDFLMFINGKVSDEELEGLVGGLMPAHLYLESGEAVDWYVHSDPNSVTYQEFEPGAFMKEWLVLGSFPVFDAELSFREKFRDGQTQMLAFDEDPFDIHKFEPIVNIDGREYQWEFYHSPSEIVDLAWPLGQQNFANAYALAQIEMSQDTPVVLAIGDDDRIKVWLNGDLVHEDRQGGHLVPDKALVPVTLRRGINRLLLKIQNGMTEWQFTFRIFEAGYNPQVDEIKSELSSVTYDGLIPGEFMKQWLLLGPIPACDGEPNWIESKVAFDMQHLESLEYFEPTIQIDDKEYAWTAYQSYTGIVDIHRPWAPKPKAEKEYVIAYAWAQIDMPEETYALLGIGSDDAVKVWLNGQLVHEKWTHHPAFPDHYRINVTFRKGLNQLVFKIQNRTNRWKFCCRLLE